MEQLAVAHRLYAEGNEIGALSLFTQLAAVGVESAQYNAAYILASCTRCPPMDKTTSPLGGSNPSASASTGGSAKLEAAFSTDPLERAHRRNHKHRTATDFRAVYQQHVQREQEQELRSASPTHGESNSPEPANVAFLPATVWKDFLLQYQPDSLKTELDVEFAAGTVLF